MDDDEVLHVAVTLQKLEKVASSAANSTDRTRAHYGTVYFPEGTTANQACEHISKRQRHVTGETGLWLLQIKSAAAAAAETKDGGDADTGGGFVNLRDGKHRLTDGNQYIALYYTGPDMYLM